jgi:cysteine desulfurase / selenocysteine lyase
MATTPEFSPPDPSQFGLPDVAAVAQLANAIFKDATSAASTPSPSVEGLTLLQPPQPQLSEKDLASIPSQLSAQTPTGLPSPQLPSATTPPALPQAPGFPGTPSLSSSGIPSGLALPGTQDIPGFGFLSEARSIFAQVPALPTQSFPDPEPVKILPKSPVSPVITQPFPAIQTQSVPQGGKPTQDALRQSPQIPGAPTHPADFDQLSSFDFLKNINPLEKPFDGIPSISPVDQNLKSPSAASISSIPFDVAAVRRDFPILSEQVNGRQLIWLDNAATTQKPQAVIDRLAYFYQHENSNIHRAAHTLAARSTDAYEGAREKIRRFLNAPSVNEIIFVRGATEGINLIASSWGVKNINKDDEIIVTHLEHHANIVPWQMLCSQKGARLKVAPVDNNGQILLDEYERLFTNKTKLVSLTHVSNALGTIVPVAEMVDIAHRHGAIAIVDGAQAVSHMQVDVQAIDCDFYVFSGHKLFAPTGIGAVFGKESVLANTPPYQGGGNMIADVTFERTQYQPPPFRFEAGTGNIADAVGLGAAIDYLSRLGMPNIARYEHDLLVYGTEALRKIPGLHLIGTASEKASVLSFVLDGYRTQEVGEALAKEGIAVRSGHHCAQPILRRFGLESTVRPSLAFYNTCDEIDALVSVLWNLKSGRVTSVV